MGQTLENLSTKKFPSSAIFNNRFVVEICEKVHVHYRNLRLNMDIDDWKSFAKGMADALVRWQKRGEPQPGNSQHIELCRKNVAVFDSSDEAIVNLNHNLYKQHEGRIFSEGTKLQDDLYVHLKIRDMRLEFTKEEFEVLSDAIVEAKSRIKDSNLDPVLQKA